MIFGATSSFDQSYGAPTILRDYTRKGTRIVKKNRRNCIIRFAVPSQCFRGRAYGDSNRNIPYISLFFCRLNKMSGRRCTKSCVRGTTEEVAPDVLTG